MTDVSTHKLMEDLKTVVADAEALMAATAGDASERAHTARQRAKESVARARERLHTLETQGKERVTAAAHQADHYVHENPWQSIAIAAGVGAIVGILLARR
jgi:ElaB/YqjD/DUF883 family membrane-anchored ribosome-binding protein